MFLTTTPQLIDSEMAGLVYLFCDRISVIKQRGLQQIMTSAFPAVPSIVLGSPVTSCRILGHTKVQNKANVSLQRDIIGAEHGALRIEIGASRFGLSDALIHSRDWRWHIYQIIQVRLG